MSITVWFPIVVGALLIFVGVMAFREKRDQVRRARFERQAGARSSRSDHVYLRGGPLEGQWRWVELDHEGPFGYNVDGLIYARTADERFQGARVLRWYDPQTSG